jgi:hypothetical protein
MKNRLNQLLILLFIISCDSPRDKFAEVTINKVGSKSFKLTPTSTAKPKCFELYNGKIYAISADESEIVVWDTNVPLEVLKVIPLFHEGENSIGVPRGFKVISDTSLLIASYFNGYGIVDLDGKLIAKEPYIKNGYDEFLPPQATSNYNNKPFVLNSGALLFGQSVPGNWQNYTTDKIQNTYLDAVHLPGKFTKYLSTTYPKDYWNDEAKHSFYHSRIYANEKLIYSFAYSHQIKVYDFDLINYQVTNENIYDAGIDNVPIPTEPNTNNIDTYMQALASKTSYNRILHDPISKLYYRLGYLPEEDKINDVDYFFLSRNRSKSFLLVLDENFKTLKKYHLEENKYSVEYSYIENGHLFISINPNLGEVSEDMWVFDAFEINK